jgi:hypothetical protein
MTKRIATLASCLMLTLALIPAVAASGAEEAPAAAEVAAPQALSPVPDGSQCAAADTEELLVDPAELAPQPEGNWDPALCLACGDYCSSDNLCYGRLLGDRCNNSGGTCQAFSGCALYNCCRCR